MHQPFGIVRFAMFTLVFGPLPEELAWRGYALDRLQMRWNALMSSLMLEGVWTVWHLPLFFIKGSYQHGLGVGTLGFWLFMMDKVPQSIIMT
jgi:membrane protease YdiL (CAAX protease family)